MPALYDTVAADLVAGPTVFRAQGQTMKFRGFTAVYVESREEDETADDEDAESAIPLLEEGEVLTLLGLDPKQHFTQPPPRFTEASLIKLLEEQGIGRPSTYASILGTIINDRGYVRRERRTLFATELGIEVTDLLLPFFKDIMNVEFTAQMEGGAGQGRRGRARLGRRRAGLLQALPSATWPTPRSACANIKGGCVRARRARECGEPLKERWGRFGKFIACSAYPECKYKKTSRQTSGRRISRPTRSAPPAASRWSSSTGASASSSRARAIRSARRPSR